MRALPFAALLALTCATCDSRGCACGGGSTTTSDAAPAGGDDAEADTQADEGDGEPAPQHPPQVMAQRYVVGWASRRLEGLETLADERALALVQRAQAGETVETPLGEVAPGGTRPSSFSFSGISLSEMGEGRVMISFTLTLRYPEMDPEESEHVLVVRQEDGIVLDWSAPSSLPGSGV